jgi:hypothetical protein
MGFIGRMPASKLTAVYYEMSGTLTLTAEIQVMEAAYGFQFRRLNFMGGLLFELIGGNGPYTGKMVDYTHTQNFSIRLPMSHFQSDEVTIITANHPEGEKVKIEYIGFPTGATNYGLQVASGSAAPPSTTKGSIEAVPGHDDLVVLVYTPFSISAPADAGRGGMVNIKYNPDFITLQSASIEDTNIVWRFSANKVGETDVIVTTALTNPSLVYSRSYGVQIIPPFAK